MKWLQAKGSFANFFLGWPKKKCSKRSKMQFDQGNIIHTFLKIKKKNPSFSVVNILTQKKIYAHVVMFDPYPIHHFFCVT